MRVFLRDGRLLSAFAILLLPGVTSAFEHTQNGWHIKKWSSGISGTSGGLVHYRLFVERVGSDLPPGPVYIDDGRSEHAEKFINSSIYTVPSGVPHTGGDTNLALRFLLTGAEHGETFYAEYDVQLKSSLPAGTRVGNYVEVNDSYDTPSNHISGDYSIWASNGNWHAWRKKVTWGEPVSAATGEFFLPAQTDLDLGGPLPVRFTRWYGSALRDPGFDAVFSTLGSNWMHNYEVQQYETDWACRRVVYHGGKLVDFAEAYYNEPSDSNVWVRNFEQEPIPYELKFDESSFWFMDPERELLYRFDESEWSHAREIVDRNGNSLLIQRRPDMLPTNVTDGLGRNLYFEYNSRSNLVRVTDGTRTVSFGQDTNRYLVAFTNPLGGVTLYNYDPTNSFISPNKALMTSVQHPRGNVPYTQAYNSNGRVVTQADAYGNTSTFEQGPITDGWARVTDPQGTLMASHFDQREATNFTDQASNSFSMAFSTQDLLSSFKDRRGNSSVYYYDVDARRLTKYVDAAHGTTTCSYVSTTQVFTNKESPTRTISFTFSDLAGVQYPDGTTEQYYRDGRGNVTSFVDRAGGIWTYTVNSRGQVLTAINPRGGGQFFTYNADGTLASVSNSGAGSMTFTYDTLRRRTKVTYPDGASDSWGLDALDRVTRATNGYAQATACEYDANSILTRTLDPVGYEVTRKTDLLDRQTNTTDSLGPLSAATYDSMGRLSTATDPGGTTTYGYDQRGWGTSVSRGGSTWQWRYDADGGVTQAVSPLGHTMTYQRNIFGSPTSIVDQLSQTSSLSFDVMEQLLVFKDSLGNAIRFGYDAGGRLVSVTNPLGASATIQRDAMGLATRRTDFDGNATDYGFDWLGRLTAVTNPLNQVISFTFDSSGRIIRQDLPDGTHETQTYDAMSRVRSRIDRGTNTWSYGYDAVGRLVAATNPAGGVTRYEYNLDGTVRIAYNSDGWSISNRYDAARRLVAIGDVLHEVPLSFLYTYGTNNELLTATDANGGTYSYEYNADGLMTSVTDPNSNRIWYAYDPAGRVTGVVDRIGGTTRFEYDAAGRLIRATDPTGLQTVFSNDAAGRCVSTTVAGKTWRTEYNGSGFPTSSVTPLGHATVTVPDALQQPATIIDSMYSSNVIVRDPMNRVVTLIDPLNISRIFTYNSRGLLSSSGGSGQAPAKYEYNALGNLISLIDPNSNTWSFSYSPMGTPQSAVDPLGRTNRFIFDQNRLLSQVQMPDGSTAYRSYDLAGNLTGVVYSTGESFSFAYDKLGGLTNANGVALQRDAEGRITNTTSTADSRAYSAAYDAAGRLVSAGYNNGSFHVNYSYDPLNGLLTGVTDTLSGASIVFQYDDDFRLTDITRGNGVNTTYEYDDANKLTRITDGSVTDLKYSYDRSGRVTGLVSMATIGAYNFIMTGNTNVMYDAAAQASSPGYQYDRCGRVTNAPGHVFSWQHPDQLTRADNAALMYDGLNGLKGRTDAGTTTWYYCNHAIGRAPIVAERNMTAGTFTRYYIWSPNGNLLYLIDVAAGNTPQYGHFDRLGSTLALTDKSGTVVKAYAYTPFGQVVGQMGTSSQPFTFLGERGVRQEGASGALYQIGARYYDATLGRFLSRDPVWPQLEDAQTANPYHCARNQPVGRVDPPGLDSLTPSNGPASSALDNTWSIDRASITDPSAIGAAPAYLNVNSYKDMQVTMGANDISAQTGGSPLSFVTKRGGNRYSGDFHLYVEGQDLETKQSPPDTTATGALRIPGVNAGGPVIKDRLWSFGSWAIQDIHNSSGSKEDTHWLEGDYILDANFKRISASIQDTTMFGKLTANAGLRYDKETGGQPGRPGMAWELISPRFSVTYDITGEGKNIVTKPVWRYVDAPVEIPCYQLPRNTSPQIEYTPLDVDDLLDLTGPDPGGPSDYGGDFNTPVLNEMELRYEKAFGDDVAQALEDFFKNRRNLGGGGR